MKPMNWSNYLYGDKVNKIHDTSLGRHGVKYISKKLTNCNRRKNRVNI